MELHWSVWVHVMYFESTEAAQEAELCSSMNFTGTDFYFVGCTGWWRMFFVSMDSLGTILKVSITFIRLSTFVVFECGGLSTWGRWAVREVLFPLVTRQSYSFQHILKKNTHTMEQQQLKSKGKEQAFLLSGENTDWLRHIIFKENSG